MQHVSFKRVKNIFSKHQNAILNEFFLNNKYPSRKGKEMIAAQSNLTFNQVHHWFEHQRAKRKDNKLIAAQKGKKM